LKKTALYDFHVKHNAKFVVCIVHQLLQQQKENEDGIVTLTLKQPYAGWKMPVMYPEGMKQEHLHTRSSASLFDVSHMGQLHLEGKDVPEFLEALVPGSIQDLKPNKSRLTQFTNENGGIMDDTVITRREEDKFYVVVNAGCCEKDLKYLTAKIEEFTSGEHAGRKVDLNFLNHYSLLALQGPQAADVLQNLIGNAYDLSELEFMTAVDVPISNLRGLDSPLQIVRCGYTGEDGFEISVPETHANQLAELLTGDERVKLAGLGARDTLRLEAGLCLMGSDMNEEITPIEAGLVFTIGKRRRETGGFPGAKVILDQLKNGVSKLRVGFTVTDSNLPAREHMEILNPENGEVIGIVTSGTVSPVLEKSIGMGYVKTAFSQIGTPIQIKRSAKLTMNATVCSLPFVPTHYYRKTK
jgi:aminomethyltransferase